MAVLSDGQPWTVHLASQIHQAAVRAATKATAAYLAEAAADMRYPPVTVLSMVDHRLTALQGHVTVPGLIGDGAVPATLTSRRTSPTTGAAAA